MRILHVVPTYLPATRYGGPIYSVHGLCAGLARRGHDVHVYTTNVDGPGVSAVPVGTPVPRDGVAVTYFSTGAGRRLYRSPSMGLALARTVGDFDLVHLHSVFLWPTAAAAAAARRAGVPYVLSPRGMLVSDLIRRKSQLIKSLWIELFERRNLAGAACVHLTSALEAEDLGRLGLPARRICVIPNGLQTPADLDGADRREGFARPVVLFLGRINWKKGLDRLIPAMAHIPGAELVIAGNDEDNDTPKLQQIASAAGVADRTHFVGPVHGERKWQLLAGAGVFALPSYSENFGIAVLEAMAAGVPVVVTPQVGLAATVAEVGAGIVVDGEPDRIGAAIAGLLADPALSRRMGEAGREAVRKRFSWDAISAQTDLLYGELAANVATRVPVCA
jgi:glycosyltransferase involved in cell wall biosynthesis